MNIIGKIKNVASMAMVVLFLLIFCFLIFGVDKNIINIFYCLIAGTIIIDVLCVVAGSIVNICASFQRWIKKMAYLKKIKSQKV